MLKSLPKKLGALLHFVYFLVVFYHSERFKEGRLGNEIYIFHCLFPSEKGLIGSMLTIEPHGFAFVSVKKSKHRFFFIQTNFHRRFFLRNLQISSIDKEEGFFCVDTQFAR